MKKEDIKLGDIITLHTGRRMIAVDFGSGIEFIREDGKTTYPITDSTVVKVENRRGKVKFSKYPTFKGLVAFHSTRLSMCAWLEKKKQISILGYISKRRKFGVDSTKKISPKGYEWYLTHCKNSSIESLGLL